MSSKFGFSGMVNRSGNNTSKNGGGKSVSDEILIRVSQINLTDSNITRIGTIQGESVNKTGRGGITVYSATPQSPNQTIYPLINEYVFIKKVFEPNNTTGKYIYSNPISVYGFASPHANPYPSNTISSLTDINNTPSPTYQQSQLGAIKGPSPSTPSELSLNNSIKEFQNSIFIEKSNINPLYPYMGDYIIEGRWGNSIRFGSTSPSKNGKSNLYSSSGTQGNPITLIRNGQNRFSSANKLDVINEDIKKDLSSIYLTSTQKIQNLSLTAGEPTFISYTNKPILPSQFNEPQIILNSNRVIIDAETDSILLSAQKSIGLLSNESINLESNGKEGNISMHASNEIKIGTLNLEPVLLGDQTTILLEYLIKTISILAESLKLNKDYPNGIPLPDSVNLITSDNVLSVLQTLQTDFLPKIKSTKVKVE